MSGKMIVLEGITGSGKKILTNQLSERIRNAGFSVANISFPNFESDIAKLTKRGRFDSRTLALLYAADRMQSQEKIKELLEKGEVIISDRYCYSNFAYQHARGMPLEWLMEIEKSIIKPDIVILIDTPVETGIKRVQQAIIEDFTKKEILDRLEKEKETIERVRETYLYLAKTDKESRWFVVDGSDIGKADEEIWRIVAEELKII
jgi:dTMP kinase